MIVKKLFLVLSISLFISSCAVLKTGKERVVADQWVELKINSLHVKRTQEEGVLGTKEGDELALVYAINSYDENGKLLVVNNGYWGTRTIQQDALILSEEFNKIRVPVPKGGKAIATLTLIEVDDYKGERKMAKIRPYTKSQRYPKVLRITNFEDDRNLSPLDFVANSLKVAGYKYFKSKQMNLSINDDLGGKMHGYDAEDLNSIIAGKKSGKETLEISGRQVNENYLYVLKYDVDVSRNAAL